MIFYQCFFIVKFEFVVVVHVVSEVKFIAGLIILFEERSLRIYNYVYQHYMISFVSHPPFESLSIIFFFF